MDGKSSFLRRIATTFAVALAIVLLLPLLLLFVVGFYVLALVQGLRALLALLLGRKAYSESTLPKPHFLEMKAVIKSEPEDESAPAS